MIILYTNAVRYHSSAMYEILMSLNEMGDELTEGDEQSFFV